MSFDKISGDRFEQLAKNYAQYWDEVASEAGFDNQQFQRSIFEQALRFLPNLRSLKILDLGIGDGNTINAFVEHGCHNITGIDLNPTMLSASEKRFGSAVRLIQGDLRALSSIFSIKEFDLIISGATIHNIPKSQRIEVWKGIELIRPQLFVTGDKIADDDPTRHAEYLKKETSAILKVYRDKYGLQEVAEAWLEHYDVDEVEKLYLSEMLEAFVKSYSIGLAEEFGMYKTVIANRI